MKHRPPFHLPDEKKEKLEKASRLEWATIFFMLSITVVMYLAMGTSQAMKTAWIEDILSLVPPIVFLLAARYRNRPPNENFPYGYRQADAIAFLCASTALFIFGLYLLYDSVIKLVTQEHPTIGTVMLFGEEIWMGWMMIAALTYSVIPPIILGRMKTPLAKELNDKTLFADATMNRDDWLTGLAAMVGVVGIGFGWWWTDAVAAGIISLQIVKDGIDNLRSSVADLINQRPTTVGSEEPEPVEERVRQRLETLDWVAAADVRLHPEGQLFSGEAFVVPREETDDLPRKLQEATAAAQSVDWRCYDIIVTAIPSLEDAS